MAPEIGKGVYGKEIDVYALGIMLYEMLTGRVPFDGESSQEIIMKHLTAQPDLANVPEPYRGVIARALAKDPAQRNNSVQEMRALIVPGSVESGLSGALPLMGGAEKAAPGMGSTEQQQAAAGLGGAAVAEAAGAATRLPEEPIAKALKAAGADLVQGWKSAELGTTTKTLILIATVPLLLFNARWLLPYGVTIFISYAIYALIRGIVLSNSQSSGRSQSVEPPILAETVTRPLADEPILAESVAEPHPAYMRRHARVQQKQRVRRCQPGMIEQQILRASLQGKEIRRHVVN